MNTFISKIRKRIGHDPIFVQAAGCIIIKNNQILLQQRSDNKSWAIHGGYSELGETFFETMERKVREELNIKVVTPKLLNIYSGNDVHEIYPNGDEVYAIVAIYLASDFEGELQPNSQDIIDLSWFDINELPQNIHKVDKKSIDEAISTYLRDFKTGE